MPIHLTRGPIQHTHAHRVTITCILSPSHRISRNSIRLHLRQQLTINPYPAMPNRIIMLIIINTLILTIPRLTTLPVILHHLAQHCSASSHTRSQLRQLLPTTLQRSFQSLHTTTNSSNLSTTTHNSIKCTILLQSHPSDLDRITPISLQPRIQTAWPAQKEHSSAARIDIHDRHGAQRQPLRNSTHSLFQSEVPTS